jgi:predicted outer membrane repeat protein
MIHQSIVQSKICSPSLGSAINMIIDTGRSPQIVFFQNGSEENFGGAVFSAAERSAVKIDEPSRPFYREMNLFVGPGVQVYVFANHLRR